MSRSRPVFHHPLTAHLAEVGAAIAPRPETDEGHGHDDDDHHEADADREGIGEYSHEGILSGVGFAGTVVSADVNVVSAHPLVSPASAASPLPGAAPGFATVIAPLPSRRSRYSVKTVNGTTLPSWLMVNVNRSDELWKRRGEFRRAVSDAL